MRRTRHCYSKRFTHIYSQWTYEKTVSITVTHLTPRQRNSIHRLNSELIDYSEGLFEWKNYRKTFSFITVGDSFQYLTLISKYISWLYFHPFKFTESMQILFNCAQNSWWIYSIPIYKFRSISDSFQKKVISFISFHFMKFRTSRQYIRIRYQKTGTARVLTDIFVMKGGWHIRCQ